MSLSFAATSFAELYDQHLVSPLFQPFAELAVQQLDLQPGERVLDVACGTGIVARLARVRVGERGHVVGVDLNEQMLEVARRAEPGVDWRAGDAGALPIAAGEQFDVVICQQGMQFFRDAAAAARQMRNALAAKGRALVSTWRPDEEMPFLHELRRIAEKHVGPVADRRHYLGTADQVENFLRAAGFADVRSTIVSRAIHFADAAVFLRMNAVALVQMSAAGAALKDEERAQAVAAIVADSAAAARAQSPGPGLTYEIRSNAVHGRVE